jgi:hypothetical protein
VRCSAYANAHAHESRVFLLDEARSDSMSRGWSSNKSDRTGGAESTNVFIPLVVPALLRRGQNVIAARITTFSS